MRPRTLRGRLAWFYAVVLTVTLGAFAATVYGIIQMEEAAEPPEVAALEPPEHTGARMLLALAAALPVALAIAIGGAILIARRGLAPLERVMRTAERVSAEQLTERIETRPGDVDEVARLVSSVNAMLERLERSVGGMRRFSADASHELRTPLAALMGELEVTLRQPRSEAALRGVAESTLEELGRMARLVEALLTLARSDASALPVAAADLDLVAAVRQFAAPYEAVLAGRDIALGWQGGELARTPTRSS